MDPLLYNPEPSYCMFPTRLPESSNVQKSGGEFLDGRRGRSERGCSALGEETTNDLVFFHQKTSRAFGERRSVNENGLGPVAEVADPETKAFYGFQIAIEHP
jgi:hypothetical protein